MPLPLADKENPEKNEPSNQIRLEELGSCTWSVKYKGQRSTASVEAWLDWKSCMLALSQQLSVLLSVSSQQTVILTQSLMI